MNKTSICLFVAATFTFTFCASVSGFLTDADNGEPLPYANVYIEGEPYGSSTNPKGFYLMDGIPGGAHKLVCSYLGYKVFTRTVTLSESDELRLDIEMQPTAEVGEEIVVEARREGGEKDLTVGHLILSGKSTRQTPQFLEADLFRTMHLLPGVVAPSDFTSALYIWGGLPSQNLVTFDGIEIYNATHLGGVFSAFVVDAIKEANLIKGGFPAKWGGRIGSVLEIINREGNRRKTHGSAEISLLSSQATIHGPLPKFAGPGAWMVSARRTYFDIMIDAMAALMDDDDFEFPYHFTDFHSKLTRDFQGGDKFSLTFYHGADVFDLEDNDDLFMKWGNNTISANFMHLFSPKYFGHFLVAYSQFGDEFRTEDEDMMKDYVKDFTGRGMVSTAFSDHTVEVGFEVKYLSILNKLEVPYVDEPVWDWDNNAGIISLYGQDEWSPSPLWRFIFGLRNEFCTSGSYFRASPRFSAMRILDTQTRIKLSIGQYYQYFQAVPKISEMGLSLFDTWVLSQDGLDPVWATHYVLRLETERFWNLPVSLDLYHKRMGNLWRHRQFYSPDEYFPDMFEIGEGWASGADFLVRINAKKWAGWISYSLGYTVNSFPNIDSGEPFYAKHDKRHNISLYAARDLGYGFNLSSSWQFNSGMPFTEPVGIYKTPDVYYYPGEWEDEWDYWRDNWYYGGYHNKRVPVYHRLDISLSQRIPYSWGDLGWFIQIINVYNRKNIYTYYYDYDYSDDTPDREELSMFPIVPSVGLRAWF